MSRRRFEPRISRIQIRTVAVRAIFVGNNNIVVNKKTVPVITIFITAKIAILST
jgi:hypothetical protein